MAGLIYQVVWSRMLTLVLGVGISARDDRTIVDYEAPRHLGAGFGFSRFNYPVATEEGAVAQVGIDRRREYAGWGDEESLIVPDPAQAARVDRAIQFRMRADRDKL